MQRSRRSNISIPEILSILKLGGTKRHCKLSTSFQSGYTTSHTWLSGQGRTDIPYIILWKNNPITVYKTPFKEGKQRKKKDDAGKQIPTIDTPVPIDVKKKISGKESTQALQKPPANKRKEYRRALAFRHNTVIIIHQSPNFIRLVVPKSKQQAYLFKQPTARHETLLPHRYNSKNQPSTPLRLV